MLFPRNLSRLMNRWMVYVEQRANESETGPSFLRSFVQLAPM